MKELGRLLQITGLVVVPMALLYYFTNRETVGEAQQVRLMYGELTILAVGAGLFVLGNYLLKR